MGYCHGSHWTLSVVATSERKVGRCRVRSFASGQTYLLARSPCRYWGVGLRVCIVPAVDRFAVGKKLGRLSQESSGSERSANTSSRLDNRPIFRDCRASGDEPRQHGGGGRDVDGARPTQGPHEGPRSEKRRV